MNTTPQPRQNGHAPAILNRPAIEHDFAHGPAPELVVEHRTIAGFLRMAPHRFHLDEIVRFGKKVGDVAESMQLAYLTTIDSSLGVLRVFPVPLMRRVYDILAAQFHWPQFVEPETVEGDAASRREMLRSYDKLSALLRSFMEAAEDPEVQHCTSVVLQRIEVDSEGLRAALTEPAAAAAAAAAVPTGPTAMANATASNQ